MGATFVTWGLLLAVILGQTPSVREGPPISHAWQAWHDAMECFRTPGRADEAGPYFQEAALKFAEHLRDEVGDPRLYRWLGYSYHAAGDLPRAILAYRRGLRLNPGDRKLEAALAHGRLQVEYPPSRAAELMQPEGEYWPGWLELHRLGFVAFAAYTVACLAVTRWRMTSRRLWFWVAVTAAVIALVPAVGSGVEWLRWQRDAASPVVVLVRSEMLRTGNGAEYPPRLDVPLPRGAEVRRLFERAGWYQVQLAGGPVGWLPRNAVVSPSEPEA